MERKVKTVTWHLRNLGLLFLFCLFTSMTIFSKVQAEESKLHVVDMESGSNTAYDILTKSDQNGLFESQPSIGMIQPISQNKGSQFSLRSILGSDNRVLITNTSTYPYTAIARLTVTYQDGTSKCGTGFMISPNLMATAGHVLINSSFSHPKKIVAEFGMYNSSIYYRTTSFSTYIYYGGYSGYDENTDYGFIVMSSNVGSITGNFGVRTAADPNQAIYVAGYPGGNPRLYVGAGNVQAITTELITYNADTEEGQSGGPVYVLYEGLPYAMAMHSGELEGVHNFGRRIDYGLYEWLYNRGYL